MPWTTVSRAGGTLKQVEGEEVPKFMGAKKVSLHQTGFQEVLAMSQMLGNYPQHVLLVGVQPVELEDYGGSLREPVRTQIEAAIQIALAYLQDFAIQAKRREIPLRPDTGLQGSISDIQRYEAERPSEQHACRVGDARVLELDRFDLAYRPIQIEEDLAFLIERLGEGPLTILSRGYGNCRISSTAVENVWWVQYFNSQDKNILNTLEIGGVPIVAAAAKEDIQDSAQRLDEIMDAYR